MFENCREHFHRYYFVENYHDDIQFTVPACTISIFVHLARTCFIVRVGIFIHNGKTPSTGVMCNLEAASFCALYWYGIRLCNIRLFHRLLNILLEDFSVFHIRSAVNNLRWALCLQCRSLVLTHSCCVHVTGSVSFSCTKQLHCTCIFNQHSYCLIVKRNITVACDLILLTTFFKLLHVGVCGEILSKETGHLDVLIRMEFGLQAQEESRS